MVLCLIVGCGSKSGRDKGLYFARVPSVATNQGEEAQILSEERRSRWISAISSDDLTEEILENDRVCEKHFVSGRAAKSWDKFNIEWVPTLLLGHKKASDRADHKEAAAKRSERARERELEKRERELELERTAKRQKLNEPGEQVSNLSFEGNEDEEKKLTVEAGTQTEEFEYLFSSLNIDRKPFDRWEFVQNEEKVKFYTGLPSFDILQNVFEHVSPFVAYKSQNLTTFQEFVMTLIKLKLDARHQDLSYRFNVSLSTVSRIFSSWMVALDVRLAPLINWPEREALWRTMPQCFKYSFGNKTTVIIDCFEVFINRPSNLLARAQTWSSYKHHNTVKVLIGITPQGTISYVSQAWGGRTSDKYLTENCGILNKLLPGDLVLADRGFTIAESYPSLVRQYLSQLAFGDKTLPSLRKPRRLTLVFNPASGSGSAETLLKKNAEPILHIAGLDVTIVKTDYEGQIKTLMQYIDPKTDGIIVAGGDGTLLEVVTGLLRRSDQEEISKIPIGVIPLGAHNSLCNRIFANKDATEARRIGNATLAIVKGYIKPVDVMEIKGDEGRSTFAMSKLHWGAFRDANEKEDKFWIVGPFRRKLSYLVAAVKDWPPFIDTILSYPTTSTEVSSDSQQGVMPHGFATASCESLNQAPQRYLDDEKSCNTISDGWITNPIQTFGLSVEPFRTEDYLTTDGFLRVDVWPSDLSKTEFIQSGWKMEKEEKQYKFQMAESPRCKSLKLKQLKLEPKDEKPSWFSIDGEPFEARAITITLLPNKLQVFFNPHKILES